MSVRSILGSQYKGHPVHRQVERLEIRISVMPKVALVDRDYIGVEQVADTRLLVSHPRRLPNELNKLLKRKQVVESMSGRRKPDIPPGRTSITGASETPRMRSCAARRATR